MLDSNSRTRYVNSSSINNNRYTQAMEQLDSSQQQQLSPAPGLQPSLQQNQGSSSPSAALLLVVLLLVVLAQCLDPVQLLLLLPLVPARPVARLLPLLLREHPSCSIQQEEQGYAAAGW